VRAVHNDGAEDVRCCAQWMAFDACPLVACLPYSAARLAAVTPEAKLIFMVRYHVFRRIPANAIMFTQQHLLCTLREQLVSCSCATRWQAFSRRR